MREDATEQEMHEDAQEGEEEESGWRTKATRRREGKERKGRARAEIQGTGQAGIHYSYVTFLKEQMDNRQRERERKEENGEGDTKRTRENRYEKDRQVSLAFPSRGFRIVRARARIQGALSSRLC